MTKGRTIRVAMIGCVATVLLLGGVLAIKFGSFTTIDQLAQVLISADKSVAFPGRIQLAIVAGSPLELDLMR